MSPKAEADSYQQALAAARAELDTLKPEGERIATRIRQIEAAIYALCNQLGLPLPTPKPPGRWKREAGPLAAASPQGEEE